MLTIAIPIYNQEKLVGEAIESCLMQCLEDKEILVIDDCSTDRTAEIAESYGVRVIKNPKNIGFAKNMEECIKHAKGEYILFLCGDDKFTHPKVASDVVEIFETCPKVGIVDRSYYQYMDGHPGAVVTVRDEILLSSVNPSGMGFRKCAMTGLTEKIYIEVPFMISNMLKNWTYKKLHYDTVAVRIHKKNQACFKGYYKGSSAENWLELGCPEVLWDFKSNYICIKNRVGQEALEKEIFLNIKLDPRILLSPKFWFYSAFALFTPACVLRELSDFYRHRIGRLFCKIQPRNTKKILNLGAGLKGGTGAINVDITPYPNIDQVVDLSVPFWPWDNNSFDVIYSSHLIEHIQDQKMFISECFRILKKGGFLCLVVPHSSSVTANGCLGHYRTYSYKTFDDYLCRDFYMFEKAKFKIVGKVICWWNSKIWYIRLLNFLITPLIRLSPEVFENIWCYWVGGAREFSWVGEKI